MKEREDKTKYGGITIICSKRWYDIISIKTLLNSLYGVNGLFDVTDKDKHSQTKGENDG